MIYEIEKENFNSIYSLLDDTMDNIEVKAVIEGINPGWIFVDSIESPQTAMVWSKGIQGFYFVGDENNPKFNNYISNFIDEEIKPRAMKRNLNQFEFSGETEKWCPILEEIFGDRDLNKSKQYIYRLNTDLWNDYEKRKLEDGFILKKIDKELLNNKRIKNLDYIISEILRWWDSCDDYLDRTFGYCILFEDKIVNYCICDFGYDNIRPMGIETLEEFRRKGLSQITTEAFIETCIKNQLSPYWECMESNIASRTLAEKLKFNRERIYTLYSFPFRSK
ncbi:hypothetical protein U472_15390 [Orenia metallireducens]|uniref:GNAT acetyltransferase n=1 Tax=Orenia metallireducens TaxID=1413210 RepID=A0A1C0A6D4_9FIRM|nr:GNAT family N-acetyltransferase [Orenia metallireducens]OCL25710.1 hypothetical protein U472_15390 [Orenia metallireducens]